MLGWPRLRRLVDVRPGEGRALVWAFLYFFFLLTSYYILRAIRDDRGIAAGAGKLHWLYAWTFGTMLAVVSVWSGLVARVRRVILLPAVYRFFVLNLLVFFVLFRLQVAWLLTARVFFVWLSVFNFFAVAIFWGLMADVFSQEQGKRLFGFIAAGGSAGAILGPLFTTLAVRGLGAANLVLVSAVLLEVVVQCCKRLVRLQRSETPAAEEPVGGSVISGIKVVFASPYLLAIAAYTLLASLAGTYSYNLLAVLVERAAMAQEVRIAYFARLDLVVSVLSLLVQALVVGRLLTRLGVGTVLALVPPLSTVAFAVLAWRPVLPVAGGLHGLRRVLSYGLWSPANGVLFTVVTREQKYKSKAFIETVVYRGGDALTSSVLAGLLGVGLGVRGAALVALPLGLIWLGVAVKVGRMHQTMAGSAQKLG
jgi:AAA family ATP:ADP antiporter